MISSASCLSTHPPLVRPTPHLCDKPCSAVHNVLLRFRLHYGRQCTIVTILPEQVTSRVADCPLKKYWNLLEISGDYWNLLEITGDYWNLLEITGDNWNLLDNQNQTTTVTATVRKSTGSEQYIKA